MNKFVIKENNRMTIKKVKALICEYCDSKGYTFLNNLLADIDYYNLSLKQIITTLKKIETAIPFYDEYHCIDWKTKQAQSAIQELIDKIKGEK